MPLVEQKLIDRMARLLVWQQTNTEVCWPNTKIKRDVYLKELNELLDELNKVSEPTCHCMLCSPPRHMLVSDAKQHDIEFHGRVFKS